MKINIGTLVLGLLIPASLLSQELEPRSLTNIPVGMNFTAAGYAWTTGNIVLDPVLPIEDLNATVHGFVAAYLRSINVFGKSGKIDAVIPYATGHWSGLVNQQFEETSRSGFGDPRIRFSVNLVGAPALSLEEYKDYRQKTIAGISMQIILPIGQYFPDRLINLGSNRFTFRPQAGVSHRVGKWYFEGYAGLWLFTLNKDFYGGNELKQNPIVTGKIHVIRSFSKGIWMSVNAGYANGGITYVSGDQSESHISTFRLGGTLAIPLGRHHTIKVIGFTTIRMDKGSDYELLSFFYQYRW